ncbi:unnamed protein product [Cylindrotheca closterium]|uniref:Orc1-like AAA ATPase domain-containing protein n=1 Tax=Cylindrotheca closterium TaxID=2856 RepID=A0AAD2PWW7_9STRA|nr:unnamed protein product [Cylindrotheca closterium]
MLSIAISPLRRRLSNDVDESKYLTPTVPAEDSDSFQGTGPASKELVVVVDSPAFQRNDSIVSDLVCDCSFASFQEDTSVDLAFNEKEPAIRHISFAHEPSRSSLCSTNFAEVDFQISIGDRSSSSPNPQGSLTDSRLCISERSCSLSSRPPRPSMLQMAQRDDENGEHPLSYSQRSSKSPSPRGRTRGISRHASNIDPSANSCGLDGEVSRNEPSSPANKSRTNRSSRSPLAMKTKKQDDDLLSQRSSAKSTSKRSSRSPMRTTNDVQDNDLLSTDCAESCDDVRFHSNRSEDGSGHFARRSDGRNEVDEALQVTAQIMATSEQEGKVQSVMDGLTINKLQYDDVGFIGREQETKLLMECYDRLTNTTAMSSLRKELVFVNGYEGVGKSSLVSSMLKVCEEGGTGFCARGKFSSVDGPYAAIASVFGQILGDIERKGWLSVRTHYNSGKLQTLGEALTAKLGPDIHLLATLIPKLKVITKGSVLRKPSSRRRRESNGFEADQYRWEYALRVLTRELNKLYSPLVLFLDNVHWADQLSLNLIDSLVSDVLNTNQLMVVGCYRSNAVVGKYHILPKKLEQLASKPAYYGFNHSDIEIGNLDQDGAHSIIMTLLSMDDKEKTEALADICFKRTHGNPFFLIEFMTMLVDESLIKFNLGSFTWSWDEAEVERETMSTENVVNIVHSRMKKLSYRAQQALEYAACLGSTIRVQCLKILISQLEADHDAETLADLLQRLEKGGFIEQIEPTQYRWVHENVRESALMLGNAADRMFQFDVGNALFHHLEDSELDEMLFEVCDLVNMGQHARRVEYAKLNLRAAEKARSISAFHSASLYVTKGIAYLPNDKWTAQHDLTLQLFTLGMEMELATGKVEEMEKYSKEILAQPNCTAIEKLPVYIAKSHKMTHMDIDHKGCTGLLRRILLETFQIRLFSTKAVLPFQATAKLVSVARTVKKLPRGALANLQPVDDSNLEAAMDLLVRLAISSYAGKNMLLHISCITKMVQMTLKHGVHPMSGYSFVGLGTCLMIVNGDVVEGATIANMANELQEVVPDDYAAASTTTISNSLVLPWSSALQSCRSALREGHISGMRSGNTESAMLSLMMHSVVFPLMMGKPLAPIESICGTIAAQCEELKLGLYSVSVRQHWELILELMGQPDSSVFSNSEVLQKEGWKPEQLMTEYIGLHVSIYSGDYESASTIALNMGDGFQKANPSNVQIMSETFLRAIALYATASSGSSKSKRTANKLKQKMGNWVSKGNPNIGHCYHLLCAEKARLDGKYEKANTLYNDAIVLAARTGHVHHAALSNERYADFLLRCMKDKEEHDYRIQEAVRFYKDWGAERRVQQLTKA